MRKYILLAITSLACTTYAKSQNIYDIVRESQYYYSGTAKTTALGGAVGALGGDISAITINPAISSTYLQSEFSFSPDINIATTKSKFTGSAQNEYSGKIGLGSIGINGIIPTGNDQGIVNFSLFAAYNRLNNYNQKYSNNGVTNSSLMNNFMSNTTYSNGKPDPENLASYYEYLAYDAYLIDTMNNDYVTCVPNDLRHLNSAEITGHSGEWTFGGGMNISNILYLGGSLNYYYSEYEINDTHSETDYLQKNSLFQSFDFHQYSKSISNGFNFKLGAIVRPVEFLRLGISMHSPTFINTDIEYFNWIAANYDTQIDDYYRYEVYPSGINNYTGKRENLKNAEFSYTQNTPWRYTGSIALIAGKKGLVSFDYERVDYKTISVKSSEDIYFQNDITKEISNQLKAVNNYRIGAEYKIIDGISLRAGYALYGSPYSSNSINKDSQTQIISGGLGYYNDGFFFDIAYSARLNESKYYQYDDPNKQLAPTTNNLNNGKLVATMGWRF